VNFHWPISAGEFFELLRPAALIVAVLLSTWVLASARRRRLHLLVAFAWALGTLLLPFVALPLYLIARSSAKRRERAMKELQQAEAPVSVARFRFIVPVVYGVLLLSSIGIYLYRDRNSIDAHLARAEQAKVLHQGEKAIREYRAALALEDNSHTHKLLGIELADAGQWSEALVELRAAERGGEPDDSLPFRIGQALEAHSQRSEAVIEYKKFLNGHACTQPLPDERCEIARKIVSDMPSQSR
jgi:tetratricopeptide (TPR) repeat protein